MADTGTSLIIQELTGDRRRVELKDRALPLNTMRFKTKQRVELTWYPGNPRATSQPLGASFDPSSFNGYWKDKYVQAFTAGFELPLILVDGAGVADVLSAVDLFDDICQKGQLLQFTWATFQRQGFLSEFEATIHNVHDVEWMMHFDWTGSGELFPPSVLPPASSIGDVAIDWVNLGDATNALLAEPQIPPGDILTTLQDRVDSVLDSVDAIGGLAAAVYDQVLTKVETAQRLASLCTQAIDAAVAAKDALEEQSLVGLAVDGVIDDQFNVPVSARVLAAKYRRDVRAKMNDARRDAALQITQASSVVNPRLLATFVARARTDLRDVSSRYYGTPDQWHRLQSFNQLPSSRVDAGYVVYVPAADGEGA